MSDCRESRTHWTGRRRWEGRVGFAGWSVIHSSACQERGTSHARNIDFWETTQVSHSSLLFGGNISSFYRGSIFFSYKFFNKDTFLSEIPIMSCFLSARPWEFCYNGVWRPAESCALPWFYLIQKYFSPWTRESGKPGSKWGSFRVIFESTVYSKSRSRPVSQMFLKWTILGSWPPLLEDLARKTM